MNRNHIDNKIEMTESDASAEEPIPSGELSPQESKTYTNISIKIALLCALIFQAAVVTQRSEVALVIPLIIAVVSYLKFREVASMVYLLIIFIGINYVLDTIKLTVLAAGAQEVLSTGFLMSVLGYAIISILLHIRILTGFGFYSLIIYGVLSLLEKPIGKIRSIAQR